MATVYGNPTDLRAWANRQKKLAALKRMANAGIDTETGVPLSIRSVVEGSPQGSKLDALRNFYPEAEPSEEGGYVVTDKSGQQKLYNPPGLDVGDLSYLNRPLWETAGGVAGAALGVPAGPAGMAIGGGLGSAISSELGVLMNNLFGGEDNRTVPEQIEEGLQTTALQMLPPFGGPAARKTIAKATGARPDVAEAASASGIRVPTGAVNRAGANLETALRATPTGEPIISNAYSQAQDDAYTAMSRLTSNITDGQAPTTIGVGEVTMDIADEGRRQFAEIREMLDEEFIELVGENTPMPISNIGKLQDTIKSAIETAPESVAPRYKEAMKRIDRAITDSQSYGGQLPVSALRGLRTEVGSLIDWNSAKTSQRVGQGPLKQLYGALKDDIRDGAKSVSKDAYDAIDAHDRFVKKSSDGPLKTMAKYARIDTPEAAYKRLMSDAKAGPTVLKDLKKSSTDGQWRQVAGGILAEMGRPTAGAAREAGEEFSFSTLVTNWNRLNDEAKDLLFTGKGMDAYRSDLENILKVSGAMKDAEARKNFSNTAQGIVGSVLSLGPAASMFAGVDPSSALSMAAAGAVAPAAAAKGLESASISRLLSDIIGGPKPGMNIPSRLLASSAQDKLDNQLDMLR